MNSYPINLDLKDRKVLVVGGGKVAYRKLNRLVTTGAKITLVAPQINYQIDTLIKQQRINYYQREFIAEDIKDKFLIIAATNNKDVNQQVAKLSTKNNRLVNVVDSTKLSNFTLPATIRQGDLLLTVATGGKLPALSRVIRQKLEEDFGVGFAYFLELMSQLRPLILEGVTDEKERRRVFRALADLELIELLAQDRIKGIKIIKDRLPNDIAAKLNVM